MCKTTIHGRYPAVTQRAVTVGLLSLCILLSAHIILAILLHVCFRSQSIHSSSHPKFPAVSLRCLACFCFRYGGCPLSFRASIHQPAMSLSSPTTPLNGTSDGVTSPKYRLVYFHTQGRAEVCRYMFALAHQPFVDERIPEPANATTRPTFDALKPSLPFGQLPVLYIDGGKDGSIVLAQSHAIERFLARRFELMGHSDVEQQLVDSVMEALTDLSLAYRRSRQDEATRTGFLSQTVPTFLQQLDRLAQRHGSHCTLVGESLTLADVLVYHNFSIPIAEQPAMNQLVDGFPRIRAAITHVAERPEIRRWVATRPA